jgi:hypothetical protein
MVHCFFQIHSFISVIDDVVAKPPCMSLMEDQSNARVPWAGQNVVCKNCGDPGFVIKCYHEKPRQDQMKTNKNTNKVSTELSNGLNEFSRGIVCMLGDRLMVFKFPPAVAGSLQAFMDYCLCQGRYGVFIMMADC